MNSESDHPESKESRLFRTAMAGFGVEPLRDPKRAPIRLDKPGSQPTRQIEDDRRVLIESMETSPNLSLHDIEANESLRKDGLSPKDFKQLKRGKYIVEDWIDLHGHTVEESKQRISEFIRYSLLGGKRCVRIVHGKGRQSHKGIPRLKIATHQLLRQNQHVLGYCRAPQSDGGGGATYVLLKSRNSIRPRG